MLRLPPFQAATIPGHTHAVRCDKSCNDFECDVDCTLRVEAATIPGHTRAVYCDKSCNYLIGIFFIERGDSGLEDDFIGILAV